MAVERVRGGERPSAVVASFGFHRTTIYKWLKAASTPGMGLKALHARPATGRPRSLTPRQEQQVFRWINGRDPRQYGLDFGLWTRSVVADLIDRLDRRLHRSHAHARPGLRSGLSRDDHHSRLGVSYLPAAGPKALKAIRQTIRGWTLQTRRDKALDDLARMFNPYIRGWINYYSHFYKSALYPTLRRIDVFLIRWARRKFKRLRQQPKGARDWLARVVRSSPDLFAYWPLLYGQGRTLGAV